MKRKALITILIVSSLFLLWFAVPGFTKNTSVFIRDFNVTEDGKEITLTVGVASSMGYIRSAAVREQQGGKLYIDCYSCFGGLNGKVGAKDTFTFSPDGSTETIALYRGSGSYETVLRKNSEGIWQREPSE